MKFFIALCFLAVAFAEPESDAQFYLNPYVHSAHATAGLVQHASGAVVPDDTLSVKAAKVQHAHAKAVEYMKKPFVYAAKPVVPAVTYTKPVVPAVTYTKPVVQVPTVAYTKPVYTYTNTPVTYAHTYAHTPLTYTYPTVHSVVKREADSEADSQVFYNNAYHYPSVYNTAAYSYPTVYNTAYPSVYSHLNAYTGAYTYPYTTYGAYRHIVKREADSEADSQYYYNSAYSYPSVYGAYNYPSVYNTAYTYPSVYNTAAYPSVYNHMAYGMYHY